jgi:REP element-mobilizing transposase RayT
MPQSFACLHCHVIFSTKNREPLILADWDSRLFEYIGGIARAKNCVLISANGMPDHVHLLVSMCKQICVSDIIRGIKSNSRIGFMKRSTICGDSHGNRDTAHSPSAIPTSIPCESISKISGNIIELDRFKKNLLRF